MREQHNEFERQQESNILREKLVELPEELGELERDCRKSN